MDKEESNLGTSCSGLTSRRIFLCHLYLLSDEKHFGTFDAGGAVIGNLSRQLPHRQPQGRYSLPHADHLTFSVDAGSGSSSQTYNYTFQERFSEDPSVAIGTVPFTQPCKTSASTTWGPADLLSIPSMWTPTKWSLDICIPPRCGPRSASTSGPVPTPRSNSATSALVPPLSLRQYRPFQ